MNMETLPDKVMTTFTNLNDQVLAEYVFIYRLNDLFAISKLSSLNNKYQVLFQRIQNRCQQLNLSFVDSLFANILADVAIEVMVSGITSFNQYIKSDSKVKVVNIKDEKTYFQYKFSTFIEMLIFTDIASTEVANTKLSSDRAYYFVNNLAKTVYYSAFDQKKTQEELLNQITLKINYDKSQISNHTVKLCLTICC
jgi:hypothetical protein